VRAGELDLIEAEFGAPVPPDEGPMGTVGAVAFDQRGRLAAATSTGGTQDKLPGRVGDTPVIGAGTYADDRAGAASATGWGEGIMRVLLTRTAIDHLISDCDPAEAGRRALATLGRVGGRGGLILLDRGGRPAAVFNTPRMARGWATHDDGPHAAVNRTDRNP
jgi:beta-aspartyl-peptidase (threonine type)